MVDKIKVEIPSLEECEYIDDMLLQYNNLCKQFDQETPFISINRCIKDKEGKVAAGIIATSVCWHILYIDTLWVDPCYRNRGYARLLLQEVEKSAKEMGCHLAHLETFDFQGKDFYLKQGYQVFGVLNDSPKRHNEYFLMKRL